ncbi:MAG: hypothetical protein BV459_06965, partial [Thermoplasmata archaeon M11B2D]
MDKKQQVLTVITLFLLVTLSSPCFQTGRGAGLPGRDDSLHVLDSNENHPPTTPHQPQGPPKGNAGDEYVFWTYATDPDGDQLYYLFDWGDSTQSSWIGPSESGLNMSAPHIWQHRG